MRMIIPISWLAPTVLLWLAGATLASAQPERAGEVDAIKRTLDEQEETIRELRGRVAELEGEAEPQPAAVSAPGPDEETGEAPSPAEDAEEEIRKGRRSPVIYRRALNDRQAAAARAGDYTLDPDYRGFIPVPNTVVMVKLNLKPRVDFVGDTGDPGTDFRFVPAKFPASGSNGWRFSANANGSQIQVDVRAPSVEGSPRVFYQNDFFGSNDSNMNYRLQHLYGEAYGFLAGFTFGVFEDPDAWPNTVDYESVNSVIFARRAVGQYERIVADDLVMTLSLEDPDLQVDPTGDPDVKERARAPDGGFALRWTPGDWGHMRASAIFRSIGADGGVVSDDDTFGWGVNTSGSLRLTSRDTFQYWFVYGEGVGGMGNDTSFVKSDAAFSAGGNLIALEYWSTMLAVTHDWTPRLSSTATHGFVNLENSSGQAGDAYHESHYASFNLVYQLFKRVRIGLEGLYGHKEVRDGRDNDIFRIQAGIALALFD